MIGVVLGLAALIGLPLAATTHELFRLGSPTLVAIEVRNPAAFARTAFIEALQQTGVTVTATPTGPNPATLLPAKDSYQQADKVAEHVSATLAQFINLIMKVSYNRGADLMTCLSAVKAGSTDGEQGLVEEVKTFTELGVPKTSVLPMDGAGSNDQGRSSPAALASFYRAATQTPYAQTLFDSLPVLGKSGTMANVLPDSPAAGHAQVKTANRVVGTPAGQARTKSDIRPRRSGCTGCRDTAAAPAAMRPGAASTEGGESEVGRRSQS